MPFEIHRHPEFSWSVSRQEALDSCPRGYYYHYYLSHNGWLGSAPEESRLAYRLKNLSSFPIILGNEVHRVAKLLERCVIEGKPWPSDAQLEEDIRETLRTAWRSSKHARSAFEARPKHSVMVDAIYFGRDAKSEGERASDKIAALIHHLFESEYFDRIKTGQVLEIPDLPDLPHFYLDGVKIWAAPDLAYVDDAGLHTVDWKSGREASKDRRQSLISTYCMRLRVPDPKPKQSDGHLVYLATATSEQVELDAAGELQVMDSIRRGIADMQALMGDAERNAPLDVDEFERRESGLCRTCNYAQLCQG